MEIGSHGEVTIDSPLRLGPYAEEVHLAQDLLAPLPVRVGCEWEGTVGLVGFLSRDLEHDDNQPLGLRLLADLVETSLLY